MKFKVNQVDIYNVILDDYFNLVGEPTSDEYKYAPIDYDEVCTSLYEANSFYGPEFVDLCADHEKQVYYIRSAIRQPIGDYAWELIWTWYQSKPEYYEKITKILQEQGGEMCEI